MDNIPIPIIRSYHFSLENNTGLEYTEWSTETKRIAGMYGIALSVHSGAFDIATNIFDVDTARVFADAAKKHQLDTREEYGYTESVYIVEPSGGLTVHSPGKSPGQF